MTASYRLNVLVCMILLSVGQSLAEYKIRSGILTQKFPSTTKFAPSSSASTTRSSTFFTLTKLYHPNLTHNTKDRQQSSLKPYYFRTNTDMPLSYQQEFNIKYRKNFIKLIENFLIKHVEKILEKEISLKELIDETDSTDSIIDYSSDGVLFDDRNETNKSEASNYSKFIAERIRNCSKSNIQMSKCRLDYGINMNMSKISSDFRKKFNKSTGHKHTTNKSQLIGQLNSLDFSSPSTLSLSKLNNYDYEFFKMKQNINNYKNHTVYFMSIIIFLSSICLILIVVLFASCVVNCKQRARLNYYNENEFFTYYNKKLPIISSVSSFSLTTTNPNLNLINPNQGFNDINYVTNNMGHMGNGAMVADFANDNFNHHHKLSTHLFGTKSSLTLRNQRQVYDQQQQQFVSNSLFSNFATSTGKSLGSSSAALLGPGSTGNLMAANYHNQQQQQQQYAVQPMSFVNKYQQRFIEGLNNPMFEPVSNYQTVSNIIPLEITREADINFNHQGPDITNRTQHQPHYNKRNSSNENLHKEHVNFIAGIKNPSKPSGKRKYKNPNRQQALPVRHDITLEREPINADKKISLPPPPPLPPQQSPTNKYDEMISNLNSNNCKSKHDSMLNQHSQQTGAIECCSLINNQINNIETALPKINLNDESCCCTSNERPLAMTGSAANVNSSFDNDNGVESQSLAQSISANINFNKHQAKNNNINNSNLTIETNDLTLIEAQPLSSANNNNNGNKNLAQRVLTKDNSIHNDQVRSSPSFIRDRYYQILREQVFPYLQKPANSLNINQSPKEIQNYSNDVLY